MLSQLRCTTSFRKLLPVFCWRDLIFCNFTQAQNAIVTENQLAGNPSSEWDISGAGSLDDPGFCHISVNKGQTIALQNQYDRCGALYDSDLSFWVGGGLGARHVGTGTRYRLLPQTQPSPLTNTTTGLSRLR